MKINLLDSSIYNLISAGEVVENPASVVKELVENSIDAGAQNVSVYIEDGGIKTIEVIDDGCGIEKDELKKTIMPHATSKINSAQDLFTISTLGFRGEALASISAVSEVEIRSKYVDSDHGAYLYSKNGSIEIGDTAYPQGTSIKVSNLFFNTPARYKFLASKSTEESYVTKQVFRLILANPNVAIRYYVNGKLTYSSPGEGLKSAVESVFLRKIADSLLEVETVENNEGIRITGYISTPEVYKNNRTNQIVILNGRVISDVTMQATIQNAYGSRLMSRCYPIYVLNIVMPFDAVDVNVHPSKKEVRFVSARRVYGVIYRSIMRTLEGYELSKSKNLMGDLLINSSKNAQNQSDISSRGEQDPNRGIVNESKITLDEALNIVRGGGNKPELEFRQASSIIKITDDLIYLKADSRSNEKYDFKIRPNTDKKTDSKPSIGYATVYKNEYANKWNFKRNIIEDPSLKAESDFNFTEVVPQELTSKEVEQTITSEPIAPKEFSYKVVGQIFDTYLVIESGEKVLFIDQHAMHERIIFDKLVEELNTKSVSTQPLLIPYVFEGSVDQINALLSQKEALLSSGFEIEPFSSDSIRIGTTPLILGDKLDVNTLFTDIADEIICGKVSKLGEISKDKLAMMACKAAMKGNTRLSDDNVAMVMDYFAKDNMPLQCPHGRPTVIIYTRTEFEKLFRRRV